MKKFKVALVGCGSVSERHFEAIIQNNNCVLTSVCDNIKFKADSASERFGATAYYDFDVMLKNADFDVLHICTPHYLHAPFAIKAMNNGKHVFCEKPLAIKYEDALDMCECAKNNNVYLATCFQNRFNETSVFLKQKATSGEMGKIIAVKSNVTWCRDEKYFADDWHGTLEKEGGGLMINQCIHTVDLIQWLVDSDVISVEASISRKKFEGIIETEDTADALIKFQNGAEALFYGSLCFKSNSSVFLEIVFENGKIIMYDDMTVVDSNGNKEMITFKKPAIGEKDYWGSGHTFIINEFYDALINKRPFDVTGEEGSRAVKIINMLYENARN